MKDNQQYFLEVEALDRKRESTHKCGEIFRSLQRRIETDCESELVVFDALADAYSSDGFAFIRCLVTPSGKLDMSDRHILMRLVLMDVSQCNVIWFQRRDDLCIPMSDYEVERPDRHRHLDAMPWIKVAHKPSKITVRCHSYAFNNRNLELCLAYIASRLDHERWLKSEEIVANDHASNVLAANNWMEAFGFTRSAG